MSSEESTQIYTRLVEEGMDARNPELIDELVTEDIVVHWMWQAPDMQGRQAFKQWLTSLWQAFPDWHGRVDSVIGEGDQFAARWTVTGTQERDWQTGAGAIPASGKRMSITGTHFGRVSGGKLAELWQGQDRLSLYQQLGAVDRLTQAAP